MRHTILLPKCQKQDFLSLAIFPFESKKSALLRAGLGNRPDDRRDERAFPAAVSANKRLIPRTGFSIAAMMCYTVHEPDYEAFSIPLFLQIYVKTLD